MRDDQFMEGKKKEKERFGHSVRPGAPLLPIHSPPKAWQRADCRSSALGEVLSELSRLPFWLFFVFLPLGPIRGYPVKVDRKSCYSTSWKHVGLCAGHAMIATELKGHDSFYT